MKQVKSNISQFKKELLNELYKNAGKFVKINHIYEKYMGNDYTFEIEDKRKVLFMLEINKVLDELVKMNWIVIYPKYGFHNGHSAIQGTTKMSFNIVEDIKAKMGTLGEIEYKRTFKDPFYKHWSMIFIAYPVLAGYIVWCVTERRYKQAESTQKSESYNNTQIDTESIKTSPNHLYLHTKKGTSDTIYITR